jgi:WD40-like Beta Propeller Repeat
VTAPNPPVDTSQSGFWFGLWTTFKLLIAVGVCSLIAIFMIASTDATDTPVAQSSGTATPEPTVEIIGPVPTSLPTPVVHSDVFIPGRLIYVKGSTIYMVHHYDAPVPLAIGREPGVSPDGTKLAYVAFYKNYQDLMLLNIQQRTHTEFLDDRPTDPTNVGTGLTASTPSWSDDGQSIYFSWSYPGAQNSPPNASTYDRQDLSVTRCAAAGPCNTGASTQITTPFFETGGDFEPAPRLADPNYLVYTKWQYQQARDNTSRSLPRLVAQNLNDGTYVNLTDILDNASEPVWSPNGRYLAFVKAADDLQSSSIYIMTFHPPGKVADYAHARLLVKGASFASHPMFSPDGSEMAFIAQSTDGKLHLYVAPITFGPNAHIGTAQEVRRVDVVDGDRLAWTQ